MSIGEHLLDRRLVLAEMITVGDDGWRIRLSDALPVDGMPLTPGVYGLHRIEAPPTRGDLVILLADGWSPASIAQLRPQLRTATASEDRAEVGVDIDAAMALQYACLSANGTTIGALVRAVRAGDPASAWGIPLDRGGLVPTWPEGLGEETTSSGVAAMLEAAQWSPMDHPGDLITTSGELGLWSEHDAHVSVLVPAVVPAGRWPLHRFHDGDGAVGMLLLRFSALPPVRWVQQGERAAGAIRLGDPDLLVEAGRTRSLPSPLVTAADGVRTFVSDGRGPRRYTLAVGLDDLGLISAVALVDGQRPDTVDLTATLLRQQAARRAEALDAAADRARQQDRVLAEIADALPELEILLDRVAAATEGQDVPSTHLAFAPGGRTCDIVLARDTAVRSGPTMVYAERSGLRLTISLDQDRTRPTPAAPTPQPEHATAASEPAPPARALSPQASVPGREPTTWSAGARVMHPRFGAGVILLVQGAPGEEEAVVDFEEVGTKRLVLAYAPLVLSVQS